MGVAVGFVVIWYVATRTDIAWPWFCAIGGAVNIAVSLGASLLLDGKQSTYSPYTVRGQQQQFAEEGTEQKDGGWYVVPGKVDRISYYLLLLFAASLLFLYLFNALID